MGFLNKTKLIFGILLLLIVTVPITIYFLQQQQESRSKATASTTLSLTPNTPVTATVGDTVSFDVMITPGSNIVTFVRLNVTYDQNVLQLSQANPFTPNTSAFPITIEGPFMTSGSVVISLSIGNDPTKAVMKPTKVGTLNFKAIGPTNGNPSSVVFGNNNLILSSAPGDQSSENVLSTTNPGSVIITESSVTSTPLSTGEPTPESSPTSLPTATAAPIPTSSGPATPVSLNILLHGIGSAGDNVNPTQSSLSNKNPVHPNRPAKVSLYNSNNELVSSASGVITYNVTSGAFEGIAYIPGDIPSGNYIIRIRSDYHLTRRVNQIVAIVNQQNVNVPAVSLVAGDINDDNVLNILDYNVLVECYSDYNSAQVCDPDKKLAADVNDDGLVNGLDYNLFVRELSNQQGD